MDLWHLGAGDLRHPLCIGRARTDPKLRVGRDVDEAALVRAIGLSAEKYCSASIMLGKTAEIRHTWEIVEA